MTAVNECGIPNVPNVAGETEHVPNFLRQRLDKLVSPSILVLNPPPTRDCTGDVDRIWEGTT
jgi:hypothetical protein